MGKRPFSLPPLGLPAEMVRFWDGAGCGAGCGVQDGFGPWTGLAFATQLGQLRLMCMTLQNFQADVNATNRKGRFETAFVCESVVLGCFTWQAHRVT